MLSSSLRGPAPGDQHFRQERMPEHLDTTQWSSVLCDACTAHRHELRGMGFYEAGTRSEAGLVLDCACCAVKPYDIVGPMSTLGYGTSAIKCVVQVQCRAYEARGKEQWAPCWAEAEGHLSCNCTHTIFKPF